MTLCPQLLDHRKQRDKHEVLTCCMELGHQGFHAPGGWRQAHPAEIAKLSPPLPMRVKAGLL